MTSCSSRTMGRALPAPVAYIRSRTTSLGTSRRSRSCPYGPASFRPWSLSLSAVAAARPGHVPRTYGRSVWKTASGFIPSGKRRLQNARSAVTPQLADRLRDAYRRPIGGVARCPPGESPALHVGHGLPVWFTESVKIRSEAAGGRVNLDFVDESLRLLCSTRESLVVTFGPAWTSAARCLTILHG